MAALEKLQNICRLCLDPSQNKAPLSDFPFVPFKAMHDKLNTVFNFTLDEMKQLPKSICHRCCTTVDDFHQYSEKVRQNQFYLRRLVEKDDKIIHSTSEWASGEGKSALIPLELVKVETELEIEDDEEAWKAGGYNLDKGAGEDDEEDDDGGGSRESGDDESEEDEDWKTGERTDNDDDKPLSDLVTRTKRKYTRRSQKIKKVKKEGGHDPSKEYRNKPKEEIEEEDRKILEYFKFICELCQAATETFIELRKHFRDQHGQRGYHRCCNKKLFKRCHLLEHIQVHLNPNLYGCDLCSKSFSSKEYLQLHKMQSHATEVDRPFKCDKCPKSFIQKGQLSSHMGRHQLFKCTKCDKVLAGKGSLSAHIVNMHSDEGRHICDTCGREFKTKPCFDKHVRKHKGLQEDTSIECHVCHMVLHNKATLKKHMIAKHTQTDEVFICNICGKQAPNKFALESHKRKVHCEEKYRCEFCDKRFKNPVTLREHRASHTGEILYTCPFCATTFNSKANMYAHRKKVHPYEWAQEKMSKGQLLLQQQVEQEPVHQQLLQE